MLLGRLIPGPVKKSLPGKAHTSVRMAIIEAPSKKIDLPVELPQPDYRPGRRLPDRFELPGKELFLLAGDETLFIPKDGKHKELPRLDLQF